MNAFSQVDLKQASLAIAERLATLIDLTQSETSVTSNWVDGDLEIDAIVKAGPFNFAVEWKASSELAAIAQGIDQVRRISSRVKPSWIPVLATRSMTESGRQLCRQSGVSWIDLAGNACIKAKGLRLYVEGRPNPFKPNGRPASVFAPKSARIARWLLSHPDQFYSQREIAQATAMDEGFTSRIVSRLEELRLIKRDPQGRICARDLNLLLDAWADEYDFSKHQVFRFHMAARSGEDLLGQVASTLERQDSKWATTGLAAAWLLSHFAGFRITTFYLSQRASLETLQSELRLRADLPGANLWLVLPNDEGVFQGAVPAGGIHCVHPVQVWLDLKGHPERAPEAAEELRAGFGWKLRAR